MNINLDGQKLARFGFTMEKGELTKELLEEIVNDFCEMRIFPRSVCPCWDGHPN